MASVGVADPDRRLRRVIATGGGTPVDPRNRWLLYRGRVAVWLDSRPEVLAQRLRRSRNVRPLIAGRDPVAALRGLSAPLQRGRVISCRPRRGSQKFFTQHSTWATASED